MNDATYDQPTGNDPYPNTRYFQIHFEHIYVELAETRQNVESLKKELETRMNSLPVNDGKTLNSTIPNTQYFQVHFEYLHHELEALKSQMREMQKLQNSCHPAADIRPDEYEQGQSALSTPPSEE